MTSNEIKKSLRRMLPGPLFNLIQRIRALGYQPPEEIGRMREKFDQLQKQVTKPGAMLLRPGIELELDAESKEPFTWFCWRSPEMVKELDLFINRVQGGTTFVDVGANHGVFSLVFLKVNPKGRVLSVDPSPIAGKIRLNNRALNKMDAAMLSYQVACGREEGEVKMHFNWHHLEISGKTDEGTENVSVPVRTLDSLCAENHLAPELVKIDVEGYELQVLQGAERTLKQAAVLFLEIHPELLEKVNVSLESIFDWLAAHGWRVGTLDGVNMARAEFCDRIHTFWTVCERQKS